MRFLTVPAHLLATFVVVASGFGVAKQTPPDPRSITGPYASLLAAAEDLGPSRAASVRLTAELRPDTDTAALSLWARRHGLAVHRAADRPWAAIEGPPSSMGGAFDVPIHDYRSSDGHVFYASSMQPGVTGAIRQDVRSVGRVLGFTPFHHAQLGPMPLEVPGGGLSPQNLLRAYDIEALRDRGFTGKGMTIVVFGFDGFEQADLDTYAATFGLPPFTPEVIGGIPAQRNGETTMNLEVAHALAPDAAMVFVNARPTVQGDGAYEKIAAMMDGASARHPGAVWSFSIGWGCDKLITAADLAPVRAALRAAHARGTTAFNAAGNLAGLECKGGDYWSTPPDTGEIGLDAVASVPEMTSVGGTSMSTASDGAWISEQAWIDVPLSQGSGGGMSGIFERPVWQQDLTAAGGDGRRLTPDVAAVADPETGVRVVLDGHVVAVGGTSLAAPLWAGMAAVVNQYLVDNGGRLLGDLNPLLYEVAQGARLPAFRDVTLGGNAVNDAGPGYDLVTGLGTPRVANLAEDLLAVQKSWIGVR